MKLEINIGKVGVGLLIMQAGMAIWVYVAITPGNQLFLAAISGLLTAAGVLLVENGIEDKINP